MPPNTHGKMAAIKVQALDQLVLSNDEGPNRQMET
jgi:hypothetical protein